MNLHPDFVLTLVGIAFLVLFCFAPITGKWFERTLASRRWPTALAVAWTILGLAILLLWYSGAVQPAPL